MRRRENQQKQPQSRPQTRLWPILRSSLVLSARQKRGLSTRCPNESDRALQAKFRIRDGHGSADLSLQKWQADGKHTFFFDRQNCRKYLVIKGAGSRIRTDDLLIANQHLKRARRTRAICQSTKAVRTHYCCSDSIRRLPTNCSGKQDVGQLDKKVDHRSKGVGQDKYGLWRK